MTDKAAPAARKKSQKRQRNWQIKTPCLEEEFNRAAAEAAATGMSKAAWSRAKMFGGDPGPRWQRRLPLEADKLRRAEVLLIKGGTNLNQIAKNGNSGFPVDLPELRLALKQWAEARDMLMEAMGKLPPEARSPGSPQGA